MCHLVLFTKQGIVGKVKGHVEGDRVGEREFCRMSADYSTFLIILNQLLAQWETCYHEVAPSTYNFKRKYRDTFFYCKVM